MIPIALGLALSIKKRNQKNKVWLFIGDMTLMMGNFYEAYNYSRNFNLPLEFVIEDNGKSVYTDTKKVWGMKKLNYPFRKAYLQTAKIVNFAEKNKKKLSELSIEEINRIEKKLTNDVLKVFDLKNSIRSKSSYGGTSFENIKKMIISYRKNKK